MPFIALVGLLALLLDSLWAYMSDGETALASFWAMFGTGEEISKSLKKTWEDLMAAGQKIWDTLGPKTLKYIGIAAAAFVAFKAGVGVFGLVAGAIGGVTAAMNVMKVAVLSNPILAILSGIALAAVLIYENWDGIVSFFTGIFDSISNTIAGWIDGVIGVLPDWLKELLGIDGGDTVKRKFQIDAEVREFGAVAADRYAGVRGGFGAHASDALSPALAAGTTTVDNRSETTFNGGITVNTQATDAKGTAAATRQELERMISSRNSGVNQGGAR